MIWHLVADKMEDPTVCCGRTDEQMNADNPENDGHGMTGRVDTCNCPGLANDHERRARLKAKEKPIPPFFSIADEMKLINDFMEKTTETMLSYELHALLEARKWAAGMGYWSMAGMLKGLNKTMYMTVPLDGSIDFLGSCRYLEEKAREMGHPGEGEYLVDKLRNREKF